MAVIDSLGISVHVHIDGAPAVEYTDPDPSPDAIYPATPVVSRYVESKVNKEYSLACETLPQHTWLSTHRDKVLSFVAHIDGTIRASKIHGPDHHDRRRPFFINGVKLRHQGASYETVSKFKFDAVKLGKSFGLSLSNQVIPDLLIYSCRRRSRCLSGKARHGTSSWAWIDPC